MKGENCFHFNLLHILYVFDCSPEWQFLELDALHIKIEFNIVSINDYIIL